MRTRGRDPLTVCVVEQNRLAAEYLVQLLGKDPTVRPLILGDFIKQDPEEMIDLIFVLDNWGLPPTLSGCLRKIRLRYPKARHLVLDREHTKEDIFRMLLLGIHGVLAHDQVAQQLLTAVHTISAGQLWISPEMLESYVRFTARLNDSRLFAAQITTSREAQIVELVKRRLSNKEIGALLKIQESTVKFHLSNIFSKLQLTSRHDLLDKEEIPGCWAEILG